MSLSRVYFGNTTYETAWKYDAINEKIEYSSMSGTREPNYDRKAKIIFKEINKPRDLFQFLNIDSSQQLSYLADMCPRTPLIEYCLNYKKFDSESNTIKCCFLIENLKFVITPYQYNRNYTTLSNQNMTNIDCIRVSGILVFIIDIKAELKNVLKKLAVELEKYIIDGDSRFYHESFQCLCFDNEKKVQADLNLIREKYKEMVNSNTKKYGKIEIIFSNTDFYKNLKSYDSLLGNFEDTMINTELLLDRFSKSENYLDWESEKCFHQLQSIYDNFRQKLKKLLINIRSQREISQFDVNYELGFSSEIQNNCNKCMEKLDWINYFNRNGIEYLSKNDKLDLEPSTLVFCYSEEEKNKKLSEWNQYIGTLSTLTVKNLRKIKVCNSDICIYEARYLPNKMGIFELVNGKLIEFKYPNNSIIQETEKKELNESMKSLMEIEDREINNNQIEKIKNSSYQSLSNHDINILLLGESGVGKSTFINAFFNYLTYKTLDEAEASNNLVQKIGSKFSFTDENYKIKTISFGDDSNECDTIGQSATQQAKAHTIKLNGDTLLRVIDTPGMGDTRGIKVDQENFQNIVKYVQTFSHLNAICFLVKPNNARFGPIFKYCFKELFSNMHKCATKNILFCFTNSRSTSYRPGDTLPALESFLNEIKAISNVEIPLNYENMFCFDNESFRYLLVSKQNLFKFNPQEKKTYNISWEKSSSEARRMLQTLLEKDVLKTDGNVFVNKSKIFLMNWGKETVEVLSMLAKCSDRMSKYDLQTGRHNRSMKQTIIYYNDKIKKRTDTILNDIAQLTCYLIQNSVAVFNDTFEATLTEHISKCESLEYTTKTVDSSLTFLKSVRASYKKMVNSYRTTNITEEQYENLEKELTNKTLIEAKQFCQKFINEFK